MRRALSLSTSILALVCCGAVHAQTASLSDSSSTDASRDGIETVVVTAERRTENLMTDADYGHCVERPGHPEAGRV